jgi:hypothetical protein
MTTLRNYTIKEIINKTSFKQGSLSANILLTAMNSGISFIKAFKMAKQLTTNK